MEAVRTIGTESPEDLSNGIFLGVIFALTLFLHGFVLNLFITLGIFGALFVLKTKEKKAKNIMAFAITYAVLSIFAYTKAANPTLFWFIISVMILLLIAVLVISVWRASIERPDNKP